MSTAQTKKIQVSISGESFQVRTPPGQASERRVEEAASLVSKKMQTIASLTHELSSTRVALMTALDLATELISAREERECELADDKAFREAIKSRSGKLLALIDRELSEKRK